MIFLITLGQLVSLITFVGVNFRSQVISSDMKQVFVGIDLNEFHCFLNLKLFKVKPSADLTAAFVIGFRNELLGTNVLFEGKRVLLVEFLEKVFSLEFSFLFMTGFSIFIARFLNKVIP